MPSCIARLFAALTLVAAAAAFAHDAPPPAVSKDGLDPGLGPLHHPVTTRNRQAQAHFDQGMRLVFAFNHEAAIKSFKHAFELDPDLAMAQWGIAYALGPNINNAMDAKAHAAAYEALQKAIALKPKASRAERAYIDALAQRYSANAQADVAPLQAAYKEAMRELVRRYPHDDDAAVLYAESLMDLNPWKFWAPDGTPAKDTLEIVAVLERVLARAPAHTGANHYYIHAVEASPHPERSLPSAKRLPALALAGKGRADDARAERARFAEAAKALSKTIQYGNNDAQMLATVAGAYLDGRLALMAGDTAAAITFARQAVAAEDALAYDEPPGWYLPARDALGAALLRAGDLPAAEQVFRDELAIHAESGRALFGLHVALSGQGRDREALVVKKRFDRAWRAADVTLK
jgi:tetratricopeptide (TPR) repeat protein